MKKIRFNQDSSCFVSINDKGFSVYNCDPLTERFSRFSEDGGFGIVEMLFRSNIFGLVGGGSTPKYPRNMAIIWDDFQTKAIAELEFTSPVTSIKLRRDSILVTIHNRAYLYNFENMKLLNTFETISNPVGLSAISNGATRIIAVPGNVPGTVIIYDTKEKIITAHNNGLSALTLSDDGLRLATASERGTIIRVWDTQTGKMLHEFRRGLEVVTITSLVFDMDTTRLAVCSDKGTMHIFSLIDTLEISNRRSNLAYISGYLPTYFSSEWSSLTFDVPPNSICRFSNNSVDTLYVVSPDNKFMKYTYDTESLQGRCVETISL